MNPRLPLPLKPIYLIAGMSMMIGLIIGIIAGKSSLGRIPHGLSIFVIVLPITTPLTLGFHTRQRWTRPLLIAFALGLGWIAFSLEARSFAAASGLMGIAAAVYLYGSESARSYYDAIRRQEPVRVEWSDLLSSHFLPIYTTALAAIIGGLLGGTLFDAGARRALLDSNDFVGFICFVSLGAACAGALGNRVGGWLLNRREVQT